jgi:hypothetical protein
MWVIKIIMRKFLVLLFTVFFFTGCYNTIEDEVMPPPENLIGIDKMVDLLAEVEIAESALRQKQNYGQEISKVKEEFYTAIFERYEVSKEQFDQSLDYYKQDLETIDMIYEQVITRLSVIESEVQLE